MYTQDEVAGPIDHAVLKPTATTADVAANAAMCRERNIGCLCVRPCDVALAVRALAESDCTVAAVVGFPHGANRPDVKALEARLAMDDGAAELDMVMNIGRFLSGDREWVKRDIAAVVAEAKPRGVLVKVILETCNLTPAQIADACRIARDAGADFVKTSTGFADGGATPDAVAVMLETVGDALAVKASGGIRTWQDAVGYLEQGCRRLGIGSSEAVLDGARADGSY